MSLSQRIKTAFGRVIVQVGRERLRRQLLTLSDRMLLDAGFAPELVKSGTKAWPWRLDQDHRGQPVLQSIQNANMGVVAPQHKTSQPASHAEAA